MSAPHDPYVALRQPEFRRFLSGTLAIFLAALIQSTVVGWQVYSLTKDPLSLGYVGLAEALPFLALTLVGGWVADQMDRRLLTLLSLLVVLAGGIWLLLLNLGIPRSVWPFYAVQALSGLGRAFLRPASVALGTELVPREVLPNAAMWRTTVFTIAAIAGPSAGGLLVGFGSPRLAYSVMTVLLGLGFVLLLTLAPRPRPATGKRLGEGLAEGIRFVFSHQVILGALSLDLFAVLFGGAIAMLPAFAQDVLHVGGVGFGFMRAAPSVGAILMSLALSHRRPLQRTGPALMWSVAFFGLTWILFAVSKSYVWSLALLAVGGALDGLSMVVRGTLTQTLTPEHLMGRVLAVNSFFIGSSNEIGAFESGLAARLLGLVPSVAFGGAMTLLTVGLTAWRAPKLRRLGAMAGLRPEAP
jgi:hypothetical protein